jgi:hypothetical protein
VFLPLAIPGWLMIPLDLELSALLEPVELEEL